MSYCYFNGSGSNCGCPENNSSSPYDNFCTNNSTNGDGCISAFNTCTGSRPCWSGWRSEEGSGCSFGRQCKCCLEDYNIASDQGSGSISAKYKDGCCKSSISGADKCAPGWCSKSNSDDCDETLKNSCTNLNGGKFCFDYCNTISKSTGKPRKENTNHWCYTETANYCAINENILKDPFCKSSIAIERQGSSSPGYPPLWADKTMHDVCTKYKDSNKKPEQCGCFYSDMPEPSCLDPNCVASSYKNRAMLDNPKNCSNVCQQIIHVNKTGGNVDINNNKFQQQCNSNLITYYNCDGKGNCLKAGDCSDCMFSEQINTQAGDNKKVMNVAGTNKDCLAKCNLANKSAFPNDKSCGGKCICDSYKKINALKGNISYNKTDFKTKCDGYQLVDYYECNGSSCKLGNDCTQCSSSDNIEECTKNCISNKEKYTDNLCNGACGCDDYVGINRLGGNINVDPIVYKKQCNKNTIPDTYYECDGVKCIKAPSCDHCVGKSGKALNDCVNSCIGISKKYKNDPTCGKNCDCSTLENINKLGGNIAVTPELMKSNCNFNEIKYYDMSTGNCGLAPDCSHCSTSSNIENCVKQCSGSNTKFKSMEECVNYPKNQKRKIIIIVVIIVIWILCMFILFHTSRTDVIEEQI